MLPIRQFNLVENLIHFYSRLDYIIAAKWLTCNDSSALYSSYIISRERITSKPIFTMNFNKEGKLLVKWSLDLRAVTGVLVNVLTANDNIMLTWHVTAAGHIYKTNAPKAIRLPESIRSSNIGFISKLDWHWLNRWIAELNWPYSIAIE